MIIHGDALDRLKELEPDSVDLVVTDPPYGYSFMGKDWDKAVPSVEIWAECLRVLKPGAFMFVMSAPRSDVQSAMTSRLMQAGFRLDFTPIYWTYASGFPKAGNIGKLVDKRLGAEREVIGSKEVTRELKRKKADGMVNPLVGQGGHKATTIDITAASSPEAKALDGSYAGFQPKPAVEVIITAMKPLSEKTFVDQALKNGHGVTWLDDCRVPTNPDTDPNKRGYGHGFTKKRGDAFFGEGGDSWQPTTGRFPANLLVSDDVLNDGRITTSRDGGKAGTTANPHHLTSWNEPYPRRAPNDSGSYSRYFDLDKWWEYADVVYGQAHSSTQERGGSNPPFSTLPFLIVPKASKSEKNRGLDTFEDRLTAGLPMRSKDGERGGTGGDGTSTDRKVTMKNHHPTVKPLKLMSYLITLGSRQGDTVLDPFVGSGTTAVAAHLLGREPIGIEREAEYVEIAKARLSHVSYTEAREVASALPQLPPEEPVEGQPPITINDFKQVSLF